MALSTAFTESLSIRHPIALAPMGGSAGGALAAAVSNGGGLGLVGAGREDPDWTDRELAMVAEGSRSRGELVIRCVRSDLESMATSTKGTVEVEVR